MLAREYNLTNQNNIYENVTPSLPANSGKKNILQDELLIYDL